MENIEKEINEINELKYNRNLKIQLTGLVGVPVIFGTHLMSQVATIYNSYAGANTLKTVAVAACVASISGAISAIKSQIEIKKLEKELNELGVDYPRKQGIKFHHLVPLISLSTIILINQLGIPLLENTKQNWYEECANNTIRAIGKKKVATIDETPIMSLNDNEDRFMMPGSYLAKELIDNNYKYCKIYDEYYTLEGTNLKSFTIAEICEPQIVITEDGNIVYKPKNGGIIKDDKEIVYTKIVLASENGEYKIPSGYIFVSIDEDIPTKKYEELNNTDIYIHVVENNDENAKSGFEGTLLVKKR